MRKWLVPAIVLTLIVVAAYFAIYRTPVLQKTLRPDPELIERDIEQAVRAYAKPSGRVDDLSVSVIQLLKNLPGVEKVIVTGAKTPAKRIIHVCDWHVVEKD